MDKRAGHSLKDALFILGHWLGNPTSTREGQRGRRTLTQPGIQGTTERYLGGEWRQLAVKTTIAAGSNHDAPGLMGQLSR
ncbi:hypothetical protein NDU88_001053 [Pleurodeles waltl]|uniref:Uncharacterized protein n=1 Tax=Pleurodeles waltl TaxID=8319 RepID=A0AAV7U715_PLEWA|nr:hypothetical protein NDU88_001053 [Pleurodeles waltl]